MDFQPSSIRNSSGNSHVARLTFAGIIILSFGQSVTTLRCNSPFVSALPREWRVDVDTIKRATFPDYGSDPRLSVIRAISTDIGKKKKRERARESGISRCRSDTNRERHNYRRSLSKPAKVCRLACWNKRHGAHRAEWSLINMVSD